MVHFGRVVPNSKGYSKEGVDIFAKKHKLEKGLLIDGG